MRGQGEGSGAVDGEREGGSCTYAKMACKFCTQPTAPHPHTHTHSYERHTPAILIFFVCSSRSWVLCWCFVLVVVVVIMINRRHLTQRTRIYNAPHTPTHSCIHSLICSALHFWIVRLLRYYLSHKESAGHGHGGAHALPHELPHKVSGMDKRQTNKLSNASIIMQSI